MLFRPLRRFFATRSQSLKAAVAFCSCRFLSSMPSTRTFPCPRGCGLVFSRPCHLERHLRGSRKYCWSSIKSRLQVRRLEKNVKQVICRRLHHTTFMSYVVSTVKRQIAVKGRVRVSFIPYGRTSLLTADAFEIGRRFCCNVQKARRGFASCKQLRARVLATAFAISLHWTDIAADVIGILPAQWNAREQRSLRHRLEIVSSKKFEIASPVYEACTKTGLLAYIRALRIY